jgi:uncharacterized LabA/DUF88 family protein
LLFLSDIFPRLVQSVNMGGKEISVGSFYGAVTAQELQSFNDYAASIDPAKDNIGNNWAQGDSGEQTKST